MTDLYLHGAEIKTVFDLLGSTENDITFSVGWALAQSEIFLSRLLDDLYPGRNYGRITAIRLQEFKGGSDRKNDEHGYTDIEIEAERLHVIFEAKRGWSLPTDQQLTKYANHLERYTKVKKSIVVLSECSAEYVKNRLPNAINDIPILYRSWKHLSQIVTKSGYDGSHAEKRVLSELNKYLEGLITMQNQQSNCVYVVSLGNDTPEWSKLSWIEIVTKKQRYFHPFGSGGWPKDPPNYLGFRYYGKLQSIHHVDSYEIVDDLSRYIPEISRKKWNAVHDRFSLVLYKLGEPIKPVADVRTGNVYRNGRVWAAIDLLLTCRTISEARDLTNERNG